MPIWVFQKRIIGNPTPEKAAFVSSFADCDELFVINQRFLRCLLLRTAKIAITVFRIFIGRSLLCQHIGKDFSEFRVLLNLCDQSRDIRG